MWFKQAALETWHQLPNSAVAAMTWIQEQKVWNEMDEADTLLTTSGLPVFFNVSNRGYIAKLPRYAQKPVFDCFFFQRVLQPGIQRFKTLYGGAGVSAAPPRPRPMVGGSQEARGECTDA